MSNASHLIALVVAGGSGQRAQTQDNELPKQYRLLEGQPLITWSLRVFLSHPQITHVQVVYDPHHKMLYENALKALEFSSERMEKLLPPVSGGQTRQQSVHAGLQALIPKACGEHTAVLVHDSARPFLTAELITRAQSALTSHVYGAIPTIPITDTVKRVNAESLVCETLPREELFLSQTPQIFWFSSLLKLHDHAQGKGPFTDDAALVEWSGHPMGTFPGDPDNMKITTALDFKKPSSSRKRVTKVAMGFDIHAFAPGDHVWLGGVKIPYTQGVDAHSDGDVILHAATDALLGILGDDDIGAHFPPSDPQWRGAASSHFLTHALNSLHTRGGELIHMDITLISQGPKLAPHRVEIRTYLANLIGLPSSSIGLKATTAEHLGALGRGEGLAAYVTATVLMPYDVP